MDRSPRGYQPSSRNWRTPDNKKTYFSYADSTSRFKSNTGTPVEESQNFVLHVTDSEKNESNTYKYYKDQGQSRLSVSKVIVISDSSESSSPEKIDRRRYQYNYSVKNLRRSDNIMIEESSSSDESNSDNEREQCSDDDKCISESIFKIPRKVLGSSDETICTSNSSKSSNISVNELNVNPKPRSPKRCDLNELFSKYSETKSKYFVDEPVSNVTFRKHSNYKNIRPKRPFYFSDMKKATESTDSRADTKGSGSSEEHEEAEVVKTTDVMDSVILESDISEIPGTPPDKNIQIEKGNEVQEVVTLTERKKKQIADWILTNSPESRSSSSCSNVSDSRKNVSSGNSSLERFELKHETPNNRGKFIKQSDSDKKQSSDHKSTNQQTPLDRFLKKVTPNEIKTPRQNKVTETPNTKGTYVIKDMGILDCADVLDNLYGNDWRKKADVLFPSSEPHLKKTQVVSRVDRAVQTEKKKFIKPSYQTVDLVSNSDSEDFNIVSKDLKSQKEKKQKAETHIDSFIDDRDSLDISGDSIYHTAVTIPLCSNNAPLTKTKNPIPENVQRILSEICDPDTDNEDAKKVIKNKPTNRRRLLFTDDDSDGSSTSEFDPDDQVLPKLIPKKDFPKALHHAPKTNSKTKTSNFEPRGVKSFLASLSSNVPMSETHPDAKIYRVNFQKMKEELSRKLFKLYNEKIFDNQLPANMSIEWNSRMRGTAGYCYNKQTIKPTCGVLRTSRIELATKIIDTPDRLRDTLVHEMCHAAVWILNEISDCHGPYWKSWVNKAMRAFPELPEIKRCHDYKISTKYTYRCTACGYSIGRHSKSIDTEKKRCGYCYGKFEVLINKSTKSGTVQTKTPVRSKEPSGFALYVKENYNSIKQNRRSMKHGEVMKILGQQFSAIKIAKKHDNVEQNNVGSSDP